MKTNEQELLDLLAEETGIEAGQLTREKRLMTDLNLDSLDYVELVMEIEDIFEISIPDSDVEDVSTVGGLIDYINGRIPSP